LKDRERRMVDSNPRWPCSRAFIFLALAGDYIDYTLEISIGLWRDSGVWPCGCRVWMGRDNFGTWWQSDVVADRRRSTVSGGSAGTELCWWLGSPTWRACRNETSRRGRCRLLVGSGTGASRFSVAAKPTDIVMVHPVQDGRRRRWSPVSGRIRSRKRGKKFRGCCLS